MHAVVKQNPESKRQSRLGSLSERRKTDPIAGLDCQIQAKTKRKTAGNCRIGQSGKAKGRFLRVLRQPASKWMAVSGTGSQSMRIFNILSLWRCLTIRSPYFCSTSSSNTRFSAPPAISRSRNLLKTLKSNPASFSSKCRAKYRK